MLLSSAPARLRPLIAAATPTEAAELVGPDSTELRDALRQRCRRLSAAMGSLAEAGEDEQIILADIDMTYLEKVRRELPLFKHRRTDLYNLEKM